MTRFWRKLIGVASISALMMASVDAVAANYYISYTSLVSGTCTSTDIQGTITGSLSVPAPPDNVVVYPSINNVPLPPSLETFNPPVDSGNFAFYYGIPNTPLPYTVTGTAFPYDNGAPLGTGVKVTYLCNSSGVLTINQPQQVFASNEPIPTLTQWGMLILSGLLMLGMLVIRRRL